MRRILTILAACASAITIGASNAGAQPPATTVVHAMAGQGKVAVSWNAVPSATLYQLWVVDLVSWKVYQVFTPASAGCPSNTGVCSVFADVTVVPGPFQALVASWNAGGYSPWSPPYDAKAEASMPRFVDANGKHVGTMIDSQKVVLPINGKPTELIVYGAGIQTQIGVNLFYAGNMCGGQAYTYGTIPDRLEITNSFANSYLRSGTLATRVVSSQKVVDGMTGVVGNCADIPNQDLHSIEVNLFDATPLLGGFVGPFRAVY